jgi:hypothetical protein
MKHHIRTTLATMSLGCPLLASGHEGHGLPGLSHWHSTDVIGFVAMVAVAFLVWHGGRK